MADIVIGIASSHTPQLSSGVDMWPDHAERDRRNPRLPGKDTRWHTYEELLADADPALGHELRPAVRDAKYRRCQDAIEALSCELNKAHADIAVVIGDDQREMFSAAATFRSRAARGRVCRHPQRLWRAGRRR
jgi:3-O-methylgallate 3,4-dioxygenase